jgi:hypothetical protein
MNILPRLETFFYMEFMEKSYRKNILPDVLKYIFFMTICRDPNKIFIETFYETFLIWNLWRIHTRKM